MPWCPKCKKNRQIGVYFKVLGCLYAEDNIDHYPDVQSESAEPEDLAYCFECEYEAPLKEFAG